MTGSAHSKELGQGQAELGGGSNEQNKLPRIPDTFVIMFVLAMLAWIATFLFTPGQFQVAGEPARILAGSYEAASAPDPAPLLGDENRTGFLDFLFAGLISGDRYSPTIGLMALLLIIGGVFGMMMRTRAVDLAMISALPDGKAQNERIIIGIFVASSIGGATIGMGEEAIAMILVLAPAMTRAGYDGVTAVICCYVGMNIGFGTSWMNPFSVIIAQSISGLPPMSGMVLRLPMWVLFTTVGAIFLWRYASSVRLGRRAPIGPKYPDIKQVDQSASNFSLAHKLIILTFVSGICWVGWGVIAKGYYLAEITAQFFAMGLVFALIARTARLDGCSLTELMEAFREGAAQLLPAVLIVGAAKGILLLLGGAEPTTISLLNSLLNGLSMLTGMVPDWLTAWTMLLTQSVINFFIISGSGQAGITMPIMAPLADLSGVSRQTAVLAFQLADGLTNLIMPTSAVLIGSLSSAGIRYGEWLRFAWKPMLGLMAIASMFVVGAHAFGF